MTKLRNKLVFVFLALLVVACLGVTVACGGDDDADATVAYTVTVTAGGVGAEGVQVTVKKGSAILGTPKTTNKDGKVEFKLAADNGYTVTLANLPEGYIVPEGTTLEFGTTNALVVALTESFAYNIKLVNPDGSAYTADGVMVGICTLDGNCLNPVFVGADGVGKVYGVDKTDYHVQVLGLPDGYAYESDSNGYSMYKNSDGYYVDEGTDNTYNSLSATKTETTVTIYKVEQLNLADKTPLTPAQIDDSGFFVEGYKAYKFEVTVAAGATVYYSYTPDIDGEYYVYATEAAAYKLNNTFLLGDSYLTGSGMFNKYGQYLLAREGDTYYLNITNSGDAEVKAEFILSTPAASKVELESPGTVTAVINRSGANAVVVLAPNAGAAYKLTLKGTGAIKQADSEFAATTTTFADADYKENSSCTVKYTEDMGGRKLCFAVSVKADSYPATIDVEVVKTADLKNTVNVVTTKETLAKYDRPAGKELVAVPLDGSVTLVKGGDGYYHIGAANGPVVMVKLNKNLDTDRFGAGGALVYMELVTDGRVSPYQIDVTTEADKASLEKGNTYDDYRELLRGFADYKYNDQNIATIPADITVKEYYVKYVNEDGAYPLTEELKGILELITAEIAGGDNFLLLPDAAAKDQWMFACYYYDDIAEADAIVGEYKTQNGSHTLAVNKNGKFTLCEIDQETSTAYDPLETGTWKNVDGVYTFTCDGAADYGSVLTYADGQFTFTDDFDTSLTLKKEWSTVPELEPVSPTDNIIGTYKPDEMSPNKNNLVVNADGTYTYGDGVTGTWGKNKNDNYYTLLDAAGKPKYTADLTEESILLFNYGDDPSDWDNIPVAELAVVAAPVEDEENIVGKYEQASMLGTITLLVKADNTYVRTENGYEVSGHWTKVDDGQYEFSEYDETFEEDIVYSVYVEDGKLAFYEGADAVETSYEFTPVVAEPETTLYSKNKYNVEVAKLELYNDGTCIFYKRLGAGFANVAEGTYVFGQSGVTITVTKIDSELADENGVTATYNNGIITVTVLSADFGDATYVFNTNTEDDNSDAELGMTLLTEDENAKFEAYDDGSFKFYLKPGSDYVKYASGTIDGETMELLSLSYKHDSVSNVETSLSAIDDGEGTIVITVKLTYNDETEEEYSFAFGA